MVQSQSHCLRINRARSIFKVHVFVTRSIDFMARVRLENSLPSYDILNVMHARVQYQTIEQMGTGK